MGVLYKSATCRYLTNLSSHPNAPCHLLKTPFPPPEGAAAWICGLGSANSSTTVLLASLRSEKHTLSIHLSPHPSPIHICFLYSPPYPSRSFLSFIYPSFPPPLFLTLFFGGWAGSCWIAQASLVLTILFSQPPECQCYPDWFFPFLFCCSPLFRVSCSPGWLECPILALLSKCHNCAQMCTGSVSFQVPWHRYALAVSFFSSLVDFLLKKKYI